MYVICGEKLANESLKPVKLERCLSTCHADFADKPLTFFSEEGSRNSVISSGTQQEHNNQSKITLGIL